MRYQFYEGTNKKGVQSIICISSFAGKPVRGVAKCAPGDTFDFEKGMKLAQLRCDKKIATKRFIRAKQKHLEALQAAAAAQDRVMAMEQYMTDSFKELEAFDAALTNMEKSL